MVTPAKKASPSWASIKSKKKPNTDSVPIVLDPAAADALNEAQLAVAVAESANKAENTTDSAAALAKARQALELARDTARLHVVTFTFRSLPRDEYEDLVDAHKPSDRQINDAVVDGRQKPGYNVDTFPPALVTACLVDPEWSDDDIKDLWHDPNWNGAETSALFFCALGVCERRRVVDLGKGSGTTLD